MKAAFTRLKCSSTPKVLEELWTRRLIALHYKNICSVDPADYGPSGAKTLQRLIDYCAEGRIVGADFRKLYRDRMLVGRLRAGSQVWAESFTDGADPLIYKVAQLTDCVEVPYVRYPVLLAIQPRQTTLTGWPSAKRALDAAVESTSLPRAVGSLDPSQLEVICYEWLRSQDLLSRLILPIGRGMVDIDIFGIDSHSRRVYAQVTHATSLAKNTTKLKRLLCHASETDRLYYFCPSTVSIDDSRVTVVTIEDVFAKLDCDPASRRMLSLMLGDLG